MRSSVKFAIQVVFAIVIAFVLRDILNVPQMIWFTAKQPLTLGRCISRCGFIIVATSNAVNFTDGWTVGWLDRCHSLAAFGWSL